MAEPTPIRPHTKAPLAKIALALVLVTAGFYLDTIPAGLCWMAAWMLYREVRWT